MTRFWMKLEQGIAFVFRSFERMHGGEIFVPKIPSIRITDLASALAPDLSQHVIGMRPGEKLHEVMCPKDDARLAVEFEDHYTLRPGIRFSQEVDYFINRLGEKGAPMQDMFEYSSETNPHFLSINEIAALNHCEVMA